jgi:glycerophosphoryl diester phosphodiesterase
MNIKFCLKSLFNFIDNWLFCPSFLFFIKVKPCQDFIIVAHRGASAYAPENTISAFSKALELGANGIECDVIFTRDNIPVISHHSDISNWVPPEQRPAIINKMDIGSVKKLDVGSWFSEEYKGETIPTLKEALDFLKGKIDRIYLHDKAENRQNNLEEEKNRVRIFAKEIRNFNMEENIVVMVESGDLSIWKSVAPEIQLLHFWIGPAYQRDRIRMEACFSSGIKHMGVYHAVDQFNFLGRIISRAGLYNMGCFIGFWPDKKTIQPYINNGCDFIVFTLNEKLSMKLYINAGFKAIGTDDPLLLVSVLNRDLF